MTEKLLDHKATKGTKCINLYVLCDWHVGAPTFEPNRRGVNKLIKRIQNDKDGLWIALGDMTENALKCSVGDVYEVRLSPHQQCDEVARLLDPIADKCLGMVSGNHGKRSYIKAGIEIDRMIAEKLGVDYYGHKICGRINITKNATVTSDYHIVAMHGLGGGRTKGAKVNMADRILDVYSCVDLGFIAHTHHLNWSIDKRYIITSNKTVYKRQKVTHIFNCGSALDYVNSYAEMGMLKPAVEGHWMVKIPQMTHSKGDKSHPKFIGKNIQAEVIYF